MQELIAAWNRVITCQDIEPPVPYREGYGIPPCRRRCLLDGVEAYRVNEGWVEYRTSLLTWDKVQTEVNIVLPPRPPPRPVQVLTGDVLFRFRI